jgi:hypothetical protein
MNEVKQKALIAFNTNPDYRQNPYPKDSREYHVYLNEINHLETKELEQQRWGY